MPVVLFVLLALPADPPPVKEPKLRDELLGRMKEDQDARKAVVPFLAPGKPATAGDPKKPEEAAAVKRVAEVDAANREWMKGVIEKHGWPGKSLVGADGAHAAWLLVQHADPDRPFQKQCLELLKDAVKAGEADGKDLAYLTDRVLVGEGKKQVYGTQLTGKDGKLVPQPVEDEAEVDARRKAVGLQPLAEYVEAANKFYKQPEPKKEPPEKKQ